MRFSKTSTPMYENIVVFGGMGRGGEGMACSFDRLTAISFT